MSVLPVVTSSRLVLSTYRDQIIPLYDPFTKRILKQGEIELEIVTDRRYFWFRKITEIRCYHFWWPSYKHRLITLSSYVSMKL